METKRSVFYRSLLESYKKFKGLFIVKSVITDLVFFFCFAVVYTFQFNPRLVQVLNDTNIIISKMSADIPVDYSQGAMLSMASYKDVFMQQFTQIMILTLLLVLFVFAFWCIFQGTNWWFVHKRIINKNKSSRSSRSSNKLVSWCKYQQRFSLMSFVWAVIFILLYIIAFKISNISIASIELISAELLLTIAGFLLLIVLYFASVNFALLDQRLGRALKGVYQIGIKRSFVVFPAFLLILVKFYILLNILSFLAFDIFWTGIIGLIFFLPLAAWSRLFFGIIIKNSE